MQEKNQFQSLDHFPITQDFSKKLPFNPINREGTIEARNILATEITEFTEKPYFLLFTIHGLFALCVLCGERVSITSLFLSHQLVHPGKGRCRSRKPDGVDEERDGVIDFVSCRALL